MREDAATPTFEPSVARDLRRGGWTIARIPAGLTLEVLRSRGAPFRGDRFFRDFGPTVVETPTIRTEIAYQAGLLPGAMNLQFEQAEASLAEFGRGAPLGVRVAIGSAATYVRLIWDHHERAGEFPLLGFYTWTTDVGPDGHIIVGVFGKLRPIVVAPHPKSGAGVGVMPLLFPRALPD